MVITIFTKLQNQAIITAGQVFGLAEWIIADSCLLFCLKEKWKYYCLKTGYIFVQKQDQCLISRFFKYVFHFTDSVASNKNGGGQDIDFDSLLKQARAGMKKK